MLIHIFRGPGRVFGCTRDSAGDNLPARFAPWTSFKTLALTRGEAVSGLNVEECLDDVEAFGFHVTDAHVRITHQVTGGEA